MRVFNTKSNILLMKDPCQFFIFLRKFWLESECWNPHKDKSFDDEIILEEKDTDDLKQNAEEKHKEVECDITLEGRGHRRKSWISWQYWRPWIGCNRRTLTIWRWYYSRRKESTTLQFIITDNCEEFIEEKHVEDDNDIILEENKILMIVEGDLKKLTVIIIWRNFF